MGSLFKCQFILLQLLDSGCKSYFRDPWNIADQIMFSILFLAIILRFTLTGDDFVYARYFYAVDLVLFYLRILQLYYVNKRLGPKVIVIGRMVCLCSVSYLLQFLTRIARSSSS